MNNDLIQMLVNLANNLTQSGTRFIMALALVMGIVSAILYLIRVTRPKNHMTGSDTSLGKIVAFLILCGGLIALKQMMNATAHQLGFGDVTFDAITYASTAKYGAAAEAINAVLTLLQLVGAIFFYQGLQRVKRSLIDGHSGLSASEDVSTGVVKLLIGILLLCNPYFLSALQNTVKIVW